MALTTEQILALPIRFFERSTKRVLFELSGGKQFYMVGGVDERPRRVGIAHFTPREMTMVVNASLDEDTFRKLVRMKEMGLAGEICDITEPAVTPETA